jgi:hypothetical protein
MNTLAEGTRWVLKGDSAKPSILFLTMLEIKESRSQHSIAEQGKP